MAKVKDTRIEAVKSLVEANKLTSLQGVFDIIPFTAVSTATGIHYSTLHKKVHTPGLLKIDECILLAEYFGITPDSILQLALNDMKYRQSRK
ncbi:hypothetical protein [Chitinophaga solisilvae]|uniref:Uncharacterized protein n=1 Tax=Chitinophaga solisilvae TaxID=1233460 RepID=A0A3S1D0I6_9BACT|nr:hypothetical protein [Chitinophaga solisilvae]NSL85588.1 hypothetical protein [Chitinophaga solisilvae]